MKIPNKEIVLNLFNYMYVILITVTILGSYFDYQRALLGIVWYGVMWMSSECPVRSYYRGNPMIIFGCTASEVKTEEEALDNLQYHLIFILIGFVIINLNMMYVFWNAFPN